MGLYETYRTQVEEAGGNWVEYPGQFKNRHSASSAANQLRHRWPHLEIQARQGVIRARVRGEGRDGVA